MSGSYYNFPSSYLNITGSPLPIHALSEVPTDIINLDLEYVWQQMYIQPKPVIIVCGFCKSHNAISNPICIQCSAPMGYGVQRTVA